MDLELNFNCGYLLQDTSAFQAVEFKEKITYQQEITKKVLDKLEIIDPTCIVAGGACRDWLMRKSATDVDIFISSKSEFSNVDIALKQLKKIGFTNAESAPYNSLDEQMYRKNPDIAGVINFWEENVKFQVILCRKGTFNIVDSFPFGICQAWWKPSVSETIRTTKHFDRSLKHKALVRLQEGYGNDDFFVKKIKEKFPDWKYYTDYIKLAMDLLDK